MIWRNVKILGRHTVDPEGVLWLASSCSEVSFLLKEANYLTFELQGDDTCSEGSNPEKALHHPRYAVYVNGELKIDERLNTSTGAVKVFENGSCGPWLIRLVKLSECTSSLLGLRGIRTDGVICPDLDRALRLEVIGDSITAGYGVEGDLTQCFSTATENAEKAFGYLTAQALNADAVLDAFSGFGLLSGYTEGDINTECTVQPYYERVGCNDSVLPGGRRVQDIPWDFSAWQPHYIVINLGTNDSSWCRCLPERMGQYREKYEGFLETVRKDNPKARILCVLGLMGESLCPYMEQAVREYCRKTGDIAVRSLWVKEQDQIRDGIGTDYHPSPRSQQILAEQVTEALRAWMKEA